MFVIRYFDLTAFLCVLLLFGDWLRNSIFPNAPFNGSLNSNSVSPSELMKVVEPMWTSFRLVEGLPTSVLLNQIPGTFAD